MTTPRSFWAHDCEAGTSGSSNSELHQEIHTLLILTNSTLRDYFVLFTAIFTLLLVRLFIEILIFTNSTPRDYLYYLQLFLLFLLVQLLFISQIVKIVRIIVKVIKIVGRQHYRRRRCYAAGCHHHSCHRYCCSSLSPLRRCYCHRSSS